MHWCNLEAHGISKDSLASYRIHLVFLVFIPYFLLNENKLINLFLSSNWTIVLSPFSLVCIFPAKQPSALVGKVSVVNFWKGHSWVNSK